MNGRPTTSPEFIAKVNKAMPYAYTAIRQCMNARNGNQPKDDKWEHNLGEMCGSLGTFVNTTLAYGVSTPEEFVSVFTDFIAKSFEDPKFAALSPANKNAVVAEMQIICEALAMPLGLVNAMREAVHEKLRPFPQSTMQKL